MTSIIQFQSDLDLRHVHLKDKLVPSWGERSNFQKAKEHVQLAVGPWTLTAVIAADEDSPLPFPGWLGQRFPGIPSFSRLWHRDLSSRNLGLYLP